MKTLIQRMNTLHLSAAIVLGACMLGAAPARAESSSVDVWASNGPFGGSSIALAIDPSNDQVAYAARMDSLYKTVDGGGRWFRLLRTSGSVNDVKLDPEQPATIYVAGWLGVIKSRDAGATWELTNQGLPVFGNPGRKVPQATKIFVDPHDTDTVFVMSGFREKLYRSTDGGRKWRPAYEGLEGGTFTDLAFDHNDTSTIYASTWNDGVFKSEDGGKSWSQLLDTLFTVTLLVTSEPGEPPSILAGTHRGNYMSTDGGTTWTASGDGPSEWSKLVADPKAQGTLYAGSALGVDKSTDHGASWTHLEGPGARYINALAADGEQVYASTSSALYRTADGGNQWQTSRHGLPVTMINRLVAHPEKGNVLYGLSDHELFKSTDRGASWEAFGTGWLQSGDDIGWFTDLAIDSENPRTMYAAVRPSNFGKGLVSGGVYRSDDGGATWSLRSDGLPVFISNVYFEAQQCTVIAVDPRQRQNVYCLALESATVATVYKSQDRAETWTRSGDGLPNRVELLRVHPTVDRLYAVSVVEGLFVSQDRGASWQPLNAPFPQTGVRLLAFDPDQPDVLYASAWVDSRRRLMKSEDGGVNWVSAQDGLPSGVSSLVHTPSAMFAGTGDGVYRSVDGARTWQAYNTGMPRYTSVTDLVVHPKQPNRIYAGTYAAGIFQVDRAPTMSFQDGRFEVEVTWDTGSATGFGHPVEIGAGEGTVALRSDSTATVEFFGANNWEMLLKVLDGREQNGHHWVLFTAATNAAYTVAIEDTSCGTTKTWENALGNIAPATIDNQAFGDCASPLPASCQEDETTLCLGADGRFRVRITWADADGKTGLGRQVDVPAGVSHSDSSGLFYFFGPDNWELLIKVLDGCDVNGSYWVLGASATNVGYTVRVTDTQTYESREYVNPQGEAASAIVDTQAFSSCGEL